MRLSLATFIESVVTLVLLLGAFPSGMEAGARRFTYVYEATTSAPGSIEVENWVTWSRSTREDSRFNQVDFRHEIEVGITDHFQTSLYFTDWSYRENPAENKRGFAYDSSALELIYNLTNPTTDLLGLAFYEELRGGPEILELESKVILQKNMGRFLCAYNATLEAKWEGPEWTERAGEFNESLGISYEPSPSCSVGLEILHEIDIPNWAAASRSIVYGGPNISYRRHRWWVTFTPLVQLTGIRSEVDFQGRMIFGVSF